MSEKRVGRLWRSAKYENICLQDYGDGLETERGLAKWFKRYNTTRPHQALNDAMPSALYWEPVSHATKPTTLEAMKPRGTLRLR